MRPEEKKKKWYPMGVFTLVLCLLFAVAVLLAAIFLHNSKYYLSGESHTMEAIRQLSGGNTVTSMEDTQNILRRVEMLEDGRIQNAEMIAWMVIPGTPVDYPVMHTDNNTYYLEHSFDNEVDVYGTPFLDVRNTSDFSDSCSVVYAHDMNNETMFGFLRQFREKEIFDSIPQGVVLLEDGVHSISFFACAPMNTEVHDVLETYLEGETSQARWLDILQEEAMQWREIAVTEDASLVALVSCDYAGKRNASSTVLVGRLEPVKE